MAEQTPNTIAILAGDIVAGQALELLLQSAGYSTRLVAETVADKLSETLDGAKLLLLTPTLNAKHRENFLNSIRGMPVAATMPALELVTTLDGVQAEKEGQVLWPCRIEYLTEKIEAALSNVPTQRAAVRLAQSRGEVHLRICDRPPL